MYISTVFPVMVAGDTGVVHAALSYIHWYVNLVTYM